MQKASWFRLHSWVGLKLAILTCFILITGTLAVLSHELDWLTNSAMRVDPATVKTQQVDWLTIYRTTQRLYPDASVNWINKPIDPWFAAEVVLLRGEEQRQRLFFHPQTGEFQGEGRWFNWQRFFRMSHRHLMMPTIIGISLVCIAGLLLFVSAISGIVMYPGWWKQFFRLPRTSHRKLFWGDTHRLLAVWSLWLLLVVCITGLWYLIELWGGRANLPANAKPVSEQALEQRVLPEANVLEQMLQQSKKLRPEMEIKGIRFPVRAGQPVVIEGQAGHVLVRQRANNMVFDPVDGHFLSRRSADTLNAHGRISEAADPLHFGTFAGMPSKVVYFVFGVLLSTLAVTGTYLYGLRLVRDRRGQVASQQQIWSQSWRDMGKWKWLANGLLLVCTLLTFYLFI